jgi:hypothetical protein
MVCDRRGDEAVFLLAFIYHITSGVWRGHARRFFYNNDKIRLKDEIKLSL